eukprot:GHVN01075859.1.p1 GENE.GHVN01075859.1~~GHVN01075859.1.p1  ORF type:complete len:665 (+),score=38.79 GHVN01075859.1:153-2147(+)
MKTVFEEPRKVYLKSSKNELFLCKGKDRCYLVGRGVIENDFSLGHNSEYLFFDPETLLSSSSISLCSNSCSGCNLCEISLIDVYSKGNCAEESVQRKENALLQTALVRKIDIFCNSGQYSELERKRNIMQKQNTSAIQILQKNKEYELKNGTLTFPSFLFLLHNVLIKVGSDVSVRPDGRLRFLGGGKTSAGLESGDRNLLLRNLSRIDDRCIGYHYDRIELIGEFVGVISKIFIPAGSSLKSLVLDTTDVNTLRLFEDNNCIDLGCSISTLELSNKAAGLFHIIRFSRTDKIERISLDAGEDGIGCLGVLKGQYIEHSEIGVVVLKEMALYYLLVIRERAEKNEKRIFAPVQELCLSAKNEDAVGSIIKKMDKRVLFKSGIKRLEFICYALRLLPVFEFPEDSIDMLNVRSVSAEEFSGIRRGHLKFCQIKKIYIEGAGIDFLQKIWTSMGSRFEEIRIVAESGYKPSAGGFDTIWGESIGKLHLVDGGICVLPGIRIGVFGAVDKLVVESRVLEESYLKEAFDLKSIGEAHFLGFGVLVLPRMRLKKDARLEILHIDAGKPEAELFLHRSEVAGIFGARRLEAVDYGLFIMAKLDIPKGHFVEHFLVKMQSMVVWEELKGQRLYIGEIKAMSLLCTREMQMKIQRDIGGFIGYSGDVEVTNC